MDSSKKEMIEKFFSKAQIMIMVEESPAVEVSLKGDVFLVDIKNPLALMELGLNLDMLKKKKDGKKSIFRKAIKDLGYKIKIKYKIFEFEI